MYIPNPNICLHKNGIDKVLRIKGLKVFNTFTNTHKFYRDSKLINHTDLPTEINILFLTVIAPAIKSNANDKNLLSLKTLKKEEIGAEKALPLIWVHPAQLGLNQGFILKENLEK